MAARELKVERLSGGQKAAILMMALGPDGMAKASQSLSPEELEAISLEIARLGPVPASVVDAVVSEWAETPADGSLELAGGVDTARDFLNQAFGADAARVFNKLEERLRTGPSLGSLKNVDAESLSNFLGTEHPQIIALVLAHLEAPLFAEVLSLMPNDLSAEVLLRNARMDKVLPDVLEIIESFLSGEASLTLPQPLSRLGGAEAVAEVLNRGAPGSDKVLLDAIEKLDPEVASQIKDLMFVFEDLMRLDDTAMQRVVSEVEATDLALALKAAADDLKAHIYKAMSQRAQAALEQEIEFLGPTRVKDVEDAQAKVVAEVRRLEEAGEIVISGGEDDVLV